MKKTAPFLLIAALMFGMVSCHNSDPKIVFQNYEYEDNPFAENEDTIGIQFSLKIQLPNMEKMNKQERNAMQAMCDTLMSRLLEPYYRFQKPDQAIKDYCDSIRKEFEEFAVIDDPTEAGTPNYQWVQEISLIPELVTPELIVYNGNIYAYTGGIHPSSTTVFFLFDLKSGKQLTEKDIFTWGEAAQPKTDDAYKALTELMHKQLQKMCEQSEDYTADDIDWESVEPNDNFEITKEALVYHFDTYEIADDNMDIVIPNHELKQYMKEDTPLYRYWFK